MIVLAAILIATLCAAMARPSGLDVVLSPEARARAMFGGDRGACRPASMWHHW